MMKRKTIALLFLMITLLCGMTGCADFAFNPIGRWDFIEQRMYIDDVLQEDDADNPVIHTSLVFQKSGTGYIDAYTGHIKTRFSYEYSYTNVTITPYDRDHSVLYHFSEENKELTTVLEEGQFNNNGKNSRYRIESVFRKS